MTYLTILPILLPLAGVILMILFWGNLTAQKILAVLFCVLLMAVNIALLILALMYGIQTYQVGNWAAPFGITLVVDIFSAVMLVMAGLIGLMVIIYSMAAIDKERATFGFYPLTLVLLMGVCGSFLTGDIFNLYVMFEVMLMASFVLMALGGERKQIEGSVKYIILNLLASALFLSATAVAYSLTGTLNMADLAVQLRQLQPAGIVTTLALLFMVAFGIKAAIFPLFFWLPASYHTPPVTVTTLFSGLLTKVGVYAMVRVFTLLFTQGSGVLHPLLLWIAGFTMVTGVLGAAAQYDFRRLLSFHIVSQIGYLIMGLGLFTQASLAAMIYFMAHVIVAKSALFMVSGVVNATEGTFNLKKLGNLYRSRPVLSILFLLPALSLAGLPPLSGFFGKLALIQGGLGVSQYAIVAVSLAVSLLTLFSMTKIWIEVFWKPMPQTPAPKPELKNTWALFAPVIVLASLTVLFGIFAGPMYNIAEQASRQLLDPNLYIQSVLLQP
ncbi:MAG: Na+/H+ antiporter subunit D [Anaerolineales bacterium]|nr:Na+/H+ antiporter subunit D [Anaerolineales bacterium]